MNKYNKKLLTIALVAARKNSKRLKNKNFIKIKGVPIIQKAVDLGIELSEIDYVILSSDSKKILAIAKNNKKLIKHYRSKNLALDKTPMLPVMQNVVIYFEKKFNTKIDKLILLDPTAPLRNKNDILEAINLFKRKKPDLVLSANETKYNPYFNLLERCKKNKKFFNIVNKLKSKKEVGSTQAAPEVLHMNCIVWIYSRRALFVEKKRIPKKTIVYKTSIQRSFDIDTKDDLYKLRYYLQ
jgi:CMP-N,N'-diacetyllegionaminic acid synthase